MAGAERIVKYPLFKNQRADFGQIRIFAIIVAEIFSKWSWKP